MRDYYEDNLSGDALRRCYEIASPRIRRYLEAEIRYVIERVSGARLVLELGCGYGRVLKPVSFIVSQAIGCDTSRRSLELAALYMRPRRNFALVRMDAARTGFRSSAFDAVFCVQNGISAFNVDRQTLAAEAMRVTKRGGRILFSSYSPRIWEERLEWFRDQSQEGLIGPIDEVRTGNGTIVCKDGFRAGTVDSAELRRLFEGLGHSVTIDEVDESSVFCTVST